MFLLAGCQGQPIKSTQQIIEEVEDKGFKRKEYITQTFRLIVFEKLTSNLTNTLHNIFVLSNSPTPKQPLALQLAERDAHPNVVYIARPCQYTSHALDLHCVPEYWF